MADSNAEILRQAVLKARAGEPKEALELLLKNPVTESGPDASHYHLTVGSLLLELGRPGEAYAHLDVVVHREGPSKPASELWRQAREQAEQQAESGTLDRASTTLETWVENRFYLPAEALLAVLAAAASIHCYRKRLSPASRKTGLRWAVIIWLMALLVSGAHLWGSRHPRSRAAINIVLRSGPSEDFMELGRVSAGSELRALERKDGWIRVRVGPDSSGWAPESSVLLLAAPSTTRES